MDLVQRSSSSLVVLSMLPLLYSYMAFIIFLPSAGYQYSWPAISELIKSRFRLVSATLSGAASESVILSCQTAQGSRKANPISCNGSTWLAGQVLTILAHFLTRSRPQRVQYWPDGTNIQSAVKCACGRRHRRRRQLACKAAKQHPFAKSQRTSPANQHSA